ncbi:MAG: trigger factor, partial [Anaerolineae bacterium]|nr:trigger factor [Anaerolineae bacterium]
MFEVKKELLDTHEALLEVVVEAQAVQNAMRSAARLIARQVNIPGFRKGKAPYGVVVRYVGESAVLQEAVDHLIEENYPSFIESADIQPYDSGALEDMQVDPLTFKIRVPLKPTITLGDYRTIRIEWEEPVVSDNDVDMVLEQAREENAILEPVERPSKMGDEVLVDVIGISNGETLVDETDINVVFSEERPFLSPEFVQALVG